MSTKFSVRTVALFCMALIACVGLVQADGKYGKLEDQMERVHKGKKSPFRTIEDQTKANSPDFAAMEKALPALEGMAKALKESKSSEVKDASDGYVSAVEALAAAVHKKDLKGSQESFKKLSNSCADCHYKNGPGGKLD